MLGWQRETYTSLLRNANYRRWFVSSLGSSLGDWLGLFALQVLVVSIAAPGSRLALFGLGGLMLARLLPSVLLGPISGVLADRYDRRLLMTGCDLGRAVLFVAIAFTRDLTVLLALVFAVEGLSMIYLTTKMAVLPAIVERSQLTEANQIALGVTFGPLPFGAGAAALLSWVGGFLDRPGLPDVEPTTVALLVNAVTFLIAAAIIWRLHLSGRPSDEGEGDPGALHRLKEGAQFIRRHGMVRSLTVGVVGTFFGGGIIVAIGPEYVRAELGRPADDWYGLIATVGFGVLAGFLLASPLAHRLGHERLLPVALIGAAALVLAPALLGSFRMVQGVGFLMGGLGAVAGVSAFTLLQERTPEEVRARTFALFLTATRLALFCALALSPFVAGAIGTPELAVGDREVALSGIRLTLLVGGLVALGTAVVQGGRLVRLRRG